MSAYTGLMAHVISFPIPVYLLSMVEYNRELRLHGAEEGAEPQNTGGGGGLASLFKNQY